MSVADADAIQRIFETQQSVTTWHEMGVQRKIELFRALRESDVNTLRARAGWDKDRDYIPDNLAEKISMTFADMLFGEDPIFKSAETVNKEIEEAQRSAAAAQQRAASRAQGVEPGTPSGQEANMPAPQTETESDLGSGAQSAIQSTKEQQEIAGGPSEQFPEDEDIIGMGGDDQDRLNDIVEANELPAELHYAEVISSSEGEVWWRIYVDRGQSNYPIIEWHSRSHVRPLYRGRKLIAAAFVSEIHRETVEDQWTVWRYIEIHAEGVVRNLLYYGTITSLGAERPLSERPETAGLESEWEHELGMLCGRVYNKLGRDRRVGISDYQNVEELLFSLNEAMTIGHENMRLTAKKRIAVPREAIGESGTFDASEDVIVMDEPLDDQLGVKTGGGKFAVLEYSFEATALIEWKLDLIATILSRVGIVAEFASAGGGVRSSGGGGVAALSGTALRMRLIPTTLSTKGKARPWDSTLPRILMLAQQIDALPEEQGGFGRSWNYPADPPAVERGEPLPTDESEETQRHVTAVSGQVESRKTAISEMHPAWDEDQVQEELDQIETELKTFGPPKPLSKGRGGPPGPTVGMSAGMGHATSTGDIGDDQG